MLESLKRNPALCSYCRKLCDNWPTSTIVKHVTFEHHSTEKELQEAAEAGCKICVQLSAHRPLNKVRYTFSKKGGCWGSWLFSSLRIPASSALTPLPGKALVSIYEARKGRRGTSFRIDVHTPLDMDSEINSEPPARYYHERVQIYFPYREPQTEAGVSMNLTQSTRDGLAISKFWHDNCETTHQKCNRSIHSTFKPTRIVDLTATRPLLRTFKDEESISKYATLSHCWGLNHLPMLTKDMLISYHKEIPDIAISQTIRDAMQIALYLGYHYIWIDSLCIIQDDEEDWKRESASMSMVYGNSGINISAAGAIDGTIGCFFPRNPNFLDKITIVSGKREIQYTSLPLRFDDWLLDTMPLMKRGWAIQERILARRTLHFAQSQLFWECRHLHACESIPHSYHKRGRVTRISLNGVESVQLWKGIVQDYSECRLTKITDKLVAISGLAQAIQSDISCRYVAGLWMTRIENQLCWCGVDLCKQRPDCYTAPTWSWASIDGPIQWTYMHRKRDPTHIKVLDVVVGYLAEGNAHGAVLSGTLSLHCEILLRVEILKKGLESHYHWTVSMGDREIECILSPDTVEDEMTVCIGTQLYLAPVEVNGNQFQGLIFTPTGIVTGQYRRIGWFRVITPPDRFGNMTPLFLPEGCNFNDGVFSRITTDEKGQELRIIDVV
ncbi:hypothetical protein ONS96_000987 [Cadophora gregata f. sp. sojae]|nr:hypothetical protein ONS96_000987 [Cadophora gregata f. sp. sojae]